VGPRAGMKGFGKSLTHRDSIPEPIIIILLIIIKGITLHVA